MPWRTIWSVAWRVLVGLYALYDIGGAPGAAQGWEDFFQPLGVERVLGVLLLVVVVVSFLPARVRERGRAAVKAWFRIDTQSASEPPPVPMQDDPRHELHAALVEKLREGRAIRQVLARGIDNPPGEYEGVRARAVTWSHEVSRLLADGAPQYSDYFWSNSEPAWVTHRGPGQENPWITVRPFFERLMGRLTNIVQRLEGGPILGPGDAFNLPAPGTTPEVRVARIEGSLDGRTVAENELSEDGKGYISRVIWDVEAEQADATQVAARVTGSCIETFSFNAEQPGHAVKITDLSVTPTEGRFTVAPVKGLASSYEARVRTTRPDRLEFEAHLEP